MLRLERRPWVRALARLALWAAPFAAILVARATGELLWLGAALVPVGLGMALLGGWETAGLYGTTLLVYLYAGLRTPEDGTRLALWFLAVPLTLFLGMTLVSLRREDHEERDHAERLTAIEERLVLARERYKTDLIIHISNQKKFRKYYLLNRVSRVFGSQLAVDKLAEVVVQELQDIIGAEHGRYLFAYQPPAAVPPVIRTLPPGLEADRLLQDQFANWATQHQTAVLVSDVQKDFRFNPDLDEGALRALMVVPLVLAGSVNGMLRAESAYPGIFSQDDLRLFTILSDLAGAAAENARLYQRTQELAITDGLTGLYLRRFFNQRLEEEVNRFREYGTPFSLLILDLDHFKRVNDKLGHLVGDRVLAQLAEVLRAEARSTDILCRFGGEEFALLLPYTPSQAGVIMAERIRVRLASRPLPSLEGKPPLTVSLGVAGCPEHALESQTLIRAADEALYEAKRQGRNQVVLSARKP
jgi:diguanylate cyclase (GGDEF)-like protein